MRGILTVINAASLADRRLASVDSFRRALNLPNADRDDYLAELLDNATSLIETDCARRFAPEDLSEAYRLPLDRNLALELLQVTRWPIVSVASITEDGTLLDPSMYELDAGKGWIYRLDENGDRTVWSAQKEIVAYRGGFTEIPPSIRDAAIRLARIPYFGNARDPLVLREETFGVLRQDFAVGTLGHGEGIPPDIAYLLDPYRSEIA